MANRYASFGVGLALGCALCFSACGGGDDDSGNAPSSDNPGMPPAGTCQAGDTKPCEDSSCNDGKPAVATCQSDQTYGECKCADTGSGGTGQTGTGAGSGGASGGAGDGGSGQTSSGGGGSNGSGGGGDGGSGGAQADGATWPMMGFDERNNYFNPGEHTLSVDNAAELAEKWRFQVQGFPPGTPIVAEGKVFVMATGGTYAIDLETGQQVWEHTDIVGTASAAYADGFVYVHTSPGTNLYKLDASTGDVVWGPVVTYSLANCDGTSSPILAGGKVFVGHSCGSIEVTGALSDLAAARGGVEAFDTETGDHLWTYWTVPDDKVGSEDGAMIWSSVSVDTEAGTVFAGSGNNYSMQGENSDSMHAMDIESGAKKWATQVHTDDLWSFGAAIGGPDTDFGANPMLAEIAGKKIVADGDKGSAFWAFDRETGQMLWSRTDLSASRDQAHGGVLMNGAFDGQYFYVVSNNPRPTTDHPEGAVLHALDANDQGNDHWSKSFDKISWGAPSLANGLLVFPNDDDLYVLDASSGDQLAMFNTGGTIAAGAAAIAGGKIVVSSGLSYPLDSNVKNNNLVICYGLP